MPFIGKTPETGAFRLIDSITTSATDTYALTVLGDHYFPESARNLIVSLNGVTQAPETAYTVSGSHIVFASALTSSDVIDYILVIGDAVDIGTPSDGTVGNAQLKASLDLSGKTLTFSNDQISGDAVHGGTISNFASTGIDDNATSTAITIDSSQNVGIGTTNPTAYSGQTNLNINSGGVSRIDFDISDSLQGYALSESGYLGLIANTSNYLMLGAGNLERMRISSAGDVQIGTAAVTGGRYFDIYNTGSTATDFAITRFITQQVGSSSTTSADIFKRKNGQFGISNNDTHADAYINFTVGATERARINSSGNLLVGTIQPNPTSPSVNEQGIELNGSDGGIRSTVESNPAATFNRKTDDGSVVLFRKNGNTVGLIGTRSAQLSIGCSGVGLEFNDANDAIIPASPNANNTRDNAIDLGMSSVRYKDLYLSGGAYIGGTGSANYLDDYEEGSWTPQVFYQNSTDQANATNTVQSGRYRKIGSLVYVTFRLDFSQGGSPVNDNIGVKNLPFAGSLNHYEGGGNAVTSSSEVGLFFTLPLSGSSAAVLVNSANVGNFGNEFGTGSNKYIRGSFTYITS